MEKQESASRLVDLRSKLALVPQSPGVYIHKARDGKILYVGKAKNLQARLRSYFTGLERHPPKTRALVSRIADFEVMVVDNENESLILENNLIKHNKPPYNILLRDDKTYPYLKLSLNEDWPRLIFTRRRKNDGALYFGPFTKGGELNSILAVVNRFFPLVKCTPTVFKAVSRPCNYYDIKRCMGPCKLAVDKSEYDGHVKNVISILQGKTSDVLAALKKDMQAAASRMDFERAATLRDQVQAVQSLSESQAVALIPGMEVDVVGSYWHGESASFYVSLVRDGRLVAGESYLVNKSLEDFAREPGEQRETAARSATLMSFLCQYYERRQVPPTIYVVQGEELMPDETERKSLEGYLARLAAERHGQGGLGQVVVHWSTQLKLNREQKTAQDKVIRENFQSLCRMTNDNARSRFQEELKIDEKSQSLMIGLQEFLGLDTLPAWIECYDISTFQGADTVASQVVFRNARPEKSEYRKYIIKEVTGQDDFASLREVMRRRFKEERRDEVPDLILIDGGEPQVREVGWLLKSLGLDHVRYVGIAKSRTKRDFQSHRVRASSERIVIPRREGGALAPGETPATRLLDVGSPAYRLVTQMRDEAHRFAITFHRKRRDASTVRSSLSDVAGLGPKRRKKLLEIFPSFTALREASAEDIAAKVGIPVVVAQRVKEAVKETGSTSESQAATA